jgi:glycosyltransferase involved in cell wall biosynthesis
MKVAEGGAVRSKVIPHGVDPRFARSPRVQRSIKEYTLDRPFRIIYVSIIDLYKHQWHVVDAVGKLRQSGLPVTLELIGPAYGPAWARLKKSLEQVDPAADFIRYSGALAHTDMHRCYADADLCVFASSCENMPNILLEGMASGLPVACSNRGPMPEVLGTGMYFDPEDVADIARALRELIDCPVLRERLAEASFKRAGGYSWKRCAAETFEFLADTVKTYKAKAPVLRAA